MPHATKKCEPIMHVAISAVPSTDARLCSDDCGLSLPMLSQSSSAMQIMVPALKRKKMKHRTSIGAVPMALCLLAATGDYSTAGPEQAVPPPTMSKLPEAIVMAPLPDGRLIGLVDRAGPNGHE